jgi:hypothetical protein
VEQQGCARRTTLVAGAQFGSVPNSFPTSPELAPRDCCGHGEVPSEAKAFLKSFKNRIAGTSGTRLRRSYSEKISAQSALVITGTDPLGSLEADPKADAREMPRGTAERLLEPDMSF